MRKLLGAFGGLALLVGACSDNSLQDLPPPSSTSSTQPEVTTTRPDFSTVVIEPVPGETTTTLATTGDATLRGVVEGPEGPLPGAIVRIERIVGDAVQVNEVRAGEDGSWTLFGTPGGRFRVRAYLPPTHASTQPQVFYLADDETRELRLRTTEFTGLAVDSTTRPSDPRVGDAVNVAVRIAERRVGDDGLGREEPVAGVTVRIESSGWTPRSEEVAVTGADGMVVFEYRCDRTSTVSAVALVGPEPVRVPLTVPGCGPMTTTTTATTTPSDDDDDDDADGTTTTEPGGRTTTTTEPA